MEKLVVGILAHVDAGKTTLSEGLLYCGGQLKKLGRVDHGNAFLDTFALERERGITIFSKQAVLPVGETELTLLDTPGHADFSSEMERTLQVLDCALLVINGSDGVQSHTRTLWRLLRRYDIPTFLFVNKMDLPGAERERLLAELRQKLDEGCVDFGMAEADLLESAALCDEEALEKYTETGTLPNLEISRLIGARKLFPCFFGAALRLEGVEELLTGLLRYGPVPVRPAAFGARIYQISRDAQGNRLTHLKITGGRLRVKTLLRGQSVQGEDWEEKADQIRIYSGVKHRMVDEVMAGTVCAVTGLTQTRPGQGLGAESGGLTPTLEPVLSYRLLLPDGCDPHTTLVKLRQLEEEDPQLHILWNEQLRQIDLRLMGQIQLEILRRLIAERFGLEVDFGAGSIVYQETIADSVEGVGHFEPLRHYAEVHLLLEPGEPGSGLRLAANCPEEMLERPWQRLVLSHLAERAHPGVLTGAPITDMKITLLAGRAHMKHTEGGDFRQATHRALRQGLLQAKSVLLEPVYDFQLELPAECVGRALADFQRMGGECAPPEVRGEESVLRGRAPVATLGDYGAAVSAYTRGRGRLTCALGGYRPCANQEEAVAAAGYDCRRDMEHTGDSVFCAQGAGFTVKWDEVRQHMHVDSGWRLPVAVQELAETDPVLRRGSRGGYLEQDKELRAIFERTYGTVKRRDILPTEQAARQTEKRYIQPRDEGPEYLLVDGYNILFAWEDLKAVARDNLDAARKLLMDILSNYQGFRGCRLILVFDAYKVIGGTEHVERYHNIDVVYTKEAETADAYIERSTYAIGRQYRVRVATSDNVEQLIIMGHGALRVSAQAFLEEVAEVQGRMQTLLERNNHKGGTGLLRAALERAEKE